ncbi:MAG: histidine kinase [Saprospiraceae bacterium]|nr:histidine kinase [Saprospiraceae bacterium]
MKLFNYIVFLLFSYYATAQSDAVFLSQKIEFNKVDLTYDEGLRNIIDIYHMEQDEDGIIWIGSTEGLYRFNGNSALNVTQAINNTQSNLIGSLWVTALSIDKENRIWFGTTNGLYFIDKTTMKCTKIEYLNTPSSDAEYVNSIDFSPHHIYISTRDGAYELDAQTLEPIKNHLANSKPIAKEYGTSSYCTSMIKFEQKNQLFILSRIGLIRINSKTSSRDTFEYSSNKNVYHHPLTPDLFNQYLVIPDYIKGIQVFDIQKEQFIPTRSKEAPNPPFRLKSIVNIGNGQYLVNAEKKGLGIYDLKQDSYVWLDFDARIKAGFYNLMKDKNGYIWFATRGEIYRSTVSFYPNDSLNTAHIDASNIFANGKKIWAATDSFQYLSLGEEDNNVEIHFHPTPGIENHILEYTYVINGGKATPIDQAYNLQLYNLNPGVHELILSGKTTNGKEIHSQPMIFEIITPFYKSMWFLFSVISSLLMVLYALYWYNKKQYIQKEQIRNSYEKKLNQLENQALRSQINPHFIFNTLNSIKYYSIQKPPEETSDFISKFSILIRRILENSKKTLIPLKEEIATLKNYTEIESLRFHEDFTTHFYIDDSIATQDFLVPPMIIQPFVENAIWHGLMHKSSDRLLTINVLRKGEGIVFQIIDNGIGRDASNKFKKTSTHKSSLGMKITQERMQLINEKNQMANSIQIIDLFDDMSPSGTQVNIFFQFINRNVTQ